MGRKPLDQAQLGLYELNSIQFKHVIHKNCGTQGGTNPNNKPWEWALQPPFSGKR